MRKVIIEINRGSGWTMRTEADTDATVDALIDYLRACAIQYPHRIVIGGSVVAEARRPHGKRGKTVIIVNQAGA
jgi:hypothetical protein